MTNELNDTEMERLCKTVHEALRAFDAGVGKPKPSWARAPKWMKQATRESIDHVLEFRDQNPGAQHEQWVRAKEQAGWKYGPVKDGRKKTHPLLIPFSELPPHEQRKDAILIALVRAIAFS